MPEYWLIDPVDQTVEVLALQDRGDRQVGQFDRQPPLISPELLPLRLSVQQMFAQGRVYPPVNAAPAIAAVTVKIW